MKKIFLSLVMNTLLLGINFCYGMDRAQEAVDSKSDLKQKSRSHIVRRDKKKDPEAAARRKSLAVPLVPATKTDEKPVHKKGRTFSLLQKLSLKPKPVAVEAEGAGDSQSAVAPQTQQASEQPASQLSTLLVLSRPVAPADESGEPKESSVESKAAASFVQKRMSVHVQVPISKNADEQTIFEPRDVVVSPAKVEATPTMNHAKEILVRKAALLRTVVYVTGPKSDDGQRAMLKRSCRDSMTDQSAKELLGSQGIGALCANPSPGQSPRTEDTVTPRSEEVTPRTNDGVTPRSAEDSPSPVDDTALVGHQDTGESTANDTANKIE